MIAHEVGPCAVCRVQLQAEVAQRQEGQRRGDAQEAAIERLQEEAAKSAEERAELMSFQHATDALREKYQRMAELAVDMQRVAQETQVGAPPCCVLCAGQVCAHLAFFMLMWLGVRLQRGHASAVSRLGARASSAPSAQHGSGRSPG